MMARLPLSVALMALLLFGTATTFTTLSGLPAFNDRLQEESIFGSQRIGPARNRYDRSDYLSLVGTSFLSTQQIPPGIQLVDGKSGSETPEVRVARAERATGLLAQSIAQAPADAETWRRLAQGLAMQGKAEGARIALGQSWELSPYNRQMGARRLALAWLLFNDRTPEDPQGLPRRPTSAEQDALVRDLDTLRKLSPREYQMHSRRFSIALEG